MAKHKLGSYVPQLRREFEDLLDEYALAQINPDPRLRGKPQHDPNDCYADIGRPKSRGGKRVKYNNSNTCNGLPRKR